MADSGLIVGTDGLARPGWATKSELLREYYDSEWGMPVRTESGVFERMSLEAFQSGLSWSTILAKRPAFREAFRGFDVEAVAQMGPAQVEALMENRGIVRNRRKIEATIDNARAALRLRDHGGLADLVWSFRPEQTPVPESVAQIPTSSPESHALAKTLKTLGFTYVGPTTMFALMEAIGIVDTHVIGSHRRGASGIWAS